MPLLEAQLIGGVWTRMDRVGPPVTDPTPGRGSLVPGTYKPDASTTGTLPGVTRTAYTVPSQGLWTVSTPGTVIENLDVYGRIKPAASGIVIRNCRIFGSPPKASPAVNEHYPLIDMSSTAANDTLIEDCDLTPSPANESVMAYGIKNGGFTARRCNISRVVDGIQTSRWPVVMEACYIHDLTWFAVDPTRTAGDATHNDGMQLQGGSTTLVNGCNVDVTVTPWTDRSLTAVVITNDYALHQWVEIRRSWFAGGSIPLNLLGGSGVSAPTNRFDLIDNTVALGQKNYGGGTPYWHVTAGSVLQGMWTETGNVRADTGSGPLLITG